MSSIVWKRRYRNDLLDRLVNDLWFRLTIAGIIIGVALGIWAILYLVNYRNVVRTHVTQVAWDTQIDVDRWQTNQHGDWSVPYGGRELDHYRKQRSTERYIAGYATKTRTERGSCSGSGTKRKCSPDRVVTTREPVYKTRPIYDTWYEYEIDEWTSIQPLKANGNGHDWYMPDTTDGTYTNGSNPRIGDKKLGMYRTHFYIVFANNSSVDMTENLWKTFNMNDEYDLVLGWFGNILEINKAGTW